MTWVQWSNGRCRLEDIGSNPALAGENDFEKAAFDFIRHWLSGNESFSLQTSGSTGAPKKIIATRQQLKASARQTIRALNLQAGSTALVCLDTHFIAGMMMLVRALEAGMNMLLVKPEANPLVNIEPVVIDFAAFVPYQATSILNSPLRDRFAKINTVLIGGAPPDRALEKEIQTLQNNVYATYGMTETLSHIALRKLSGGRAQAHYQALPGISLSADHRGCLVVHAPHLSGQAFVTNDLVELLAADAFRWLGRIDHVINTGGVKVIPETAERKIGEIMERLQIQQRYFITGLSDPQFGQRVALILEGKPLSSEAESILKKEMELHLDRYERPRIIHYIDHFEVTASGKVNKPKTREKAGLK